MDCYYIKIINIKTMNKYFSIFYLGSLSIYIFNPQSNIQFLYYIFYLIFLFHTILMISNVYLKKKNPNFMNEETITEIELMCYDRQHHPKKHVFYKLIDIIFNTLFVLSILFIPFLKITVFLSIVWLTHVLFVGSNILYFQLIKETVKNTMKAYKEKGDSELAIINNHEEEINV